MITRSNRGTALAVSAIVLVLAAVAFYAASALAGMSMTTATASRPLANDPTGAMCEVVTVKMSEEEFSRGTTDLFAYAAQHPDLVIASESGNEPCGAVEPPKQLP